MAMEISPGKTTIGWIGTGIMGAPMAGHLLRAGYQLSVHNRTRSKAEPLLQQGATWADSPADCAAEADVIFTIVGFPADVEQVHLGDKGIIHSIRKGAIVVDMTTSEPSLAKRLADEYRQKGVSSLDAPVSGGDVGAREARLAIMVGGEQDAFKTVLPLFELMGKNIAYMGPAGAGQHTKMCNQILIAGTMIGMCESLIYAAKAGLDQSAVIDIISKGAAGCWSISNLGPRIIKRDFAPGFIVEHFIKDMKIALSEAKAMNLKLPGLELVEKLYERLAQIGSEHDGTHALIRVLEEMAGE